MSVLRKLAFSVFLILFLVRPAFAKKVSVEWKEIKGAADYEIQIQKGEKVVLQKKVDDTSWSGTLDFGVYAYQIRAYDKVKRPGIWSSLKPLVVMPSPPELVSPDGGKQVFYGPDSRATFKWKPVQGASHYLLEVKRDDETIFKDDVEETEKELQHLKPGAYKWQVTAVVEAAGRNPASFAGKKWESKPSGSDGFRMVQETLDAPVQVFPKGELKPPADGKLEFKWKPVTGAEAYELRLIQLDKDGRAPASADPASAVTKTLTTRSTSMVSNVSGEGRYRWQVRALAAIQDSKPEAVGPESQMDFDLDRNADFFAGTGYVALSTMFAPYTYNLSLSSGQGNVGESASSSAFTGRLSGEYWVVPQVGIAASYDHTMYEVDNVAYGRNDIELDVKYRVNVSRDKYAWFFSPKVGILRRDSAFIVAQGPGVQDQAIGFSTLGPTIGFDVRKQLGEHLSLGAKFAYYYPLAISGGTVTGGNSGGSNASDLHLMRGNNNYNVRNFGLGAQAVYWLSRHWSVGGGIYVEQRSVAAFEPASGGDSGGSGDLKMDGSYFFWSLIYTFGH